MYPIVQFYVLFFLTHHQRYLIDVPRNTLTELESNVMFSVDRNPDEFKHMRRCPYFPFLDFCRHKCTGVSRISQVEVFDSLGQI